MNANLHREIVEPSDVALVAGMITDASMCLSCIARKSGAPTTQVNARLRSIAASVRLAVAIRQCAACLERKITFGLHTNGHPKDAE